MIAPRSMKREKPTLLIATDVVDQTSIDQLSMFSKIYRLSELSADRLKELLPEIEILLVFSWPKELTAESLQKMTQLRFIQSILAGVNHVPFGSLSQKVLVSSNAGAYSDEVAEYAWALLLAAAKRIVELDRSLREEKWALRRTIDEGTSITILKEKMVGILGLGGIGSAVARIAVGFGSHVLAYSRKLQHVKGVKVFTGDGGLSDLLKGSDAVVLALPLTTHTTKIINRERLSEMKNSAIVVNVARGELVDEKAMYDHLVANANFKYATDVWWYRESKESLKTDYPFQSLPNFIGTPHVSGPSGAATGRPAKLAAENTLRFLRGQRVHNIVNRAEYLTSYPY